MNRFLDNDTIYFYVSQGAGDNLHIDSWFLVDISDTENPALTYSTPLNAEDSVYTVTIATVPQITADGNIVIFISEGQTSTTESQRMSSFKLNTSNTTVDEGNKKITFFGTTDQINTAIANSTVDIASGATDDITFTVTLTTKEDQTAIRTFTIKN